MITIAVVVTSLDGKLTKGDDPEVKNWSSKEDWEHFVAVRDASDAIIMGSNTYEAAKEHINTSIKGRRIVMTRSPERYKDQAVPDKLEFTDTSAAEIMQDCRTRGYEQVMIAGGSHVYASFFQQALIDEIYTTVEPKLFGEGTPLLHKAVDIDLELLGVEKLNNKGALLLHYKVL